MRKISINTDKKEQSDRALIDSLYSDAAILSFIISYLLPYSRKNRWTSFEEIMKINAIVNLQFTEERVLNILCTQVCSESFDKKRENGDLYVRLSLSDFYTLEERSNPNSNYNTQSID